MDKAFADCESLNEPTKFTTKDIDDIFKATFHYDEGFEWRFTEPTERLYHLADGMCFSITLEQLRAGLRPKCHGFFKSLYRDGLGFMFPNLHQIVFVISIGL